MRSILIILSLMAVSSGCATSEPGRETLHKGAYRPPAPAPTRPGVGLPVHDPQAKPLPPQPNPKPKRVLPPTREPGLWAGDEPQAAKKRLPPVVSLEVVIPYPPELYWGREIPFPTARCALLMDAALFRSGKSEEVARLPPAARECLAARLHLKCMESEIGAVVAQRKADGEPDDPDEAIEPLMQFARSFDKDKCTEALRTATESLYGKIMRKFVGKGLPR